MNEMEDPVPKTEQVPLKQESFDLTQIIVAVLIVILTLVLFTLYKRRKRSKRGVLFTGLCESGKTVLFSQLIHKKFVNTHTSIKENVADYTIDNKRPLRVIDIPGHERLRQNFFDQYKINARGIVFVIDSVTIQKDVRDVAEFLYNVLSDNVVRSNAQSMLILCNKQDMSLAKGANAVRAILEKELNTLKVTKSSQLDSVDPKAKKAVALGKSDEDFDFMQLHISVDFVECTAYSKDEKIDIEGLEKWMSKIA